MSRVVWDDDEPVKPRVQWDDGIPAGMKDPGYLRSAALAIAQGGTADFADEIGGLVGKTVLPKTTVKLGRGARPDPDDSPELRAAKEDAIAGEASRPTNYQVMRDSIRKEDKEAQAFHKKLYGPLKLASNLATIPVLGAAGKTAQAVGLLPKAKAGITAAALLAEKGAPLTKGLGGLMFSGAKAGAGAGAIQGLGSSESERLDQQAMDTLNGGWKGGLAGALLPAALRAGQGVVRGIDAGADAISRGLVKPTAAAQRLMDQGVPLTVGNMNPNSWIAKAEEVSANTLTGQGVKGQRDRAVKGWENLGVNKARAPGSAPIDPTATNPDKFKALWEGMDGDEAYGAIKGIRVNPEMHIGSGKWRGLMTDEDMVGSAKVKGLWELATSNPNNFASDGAKKNIRAFLENQYTTLPRGAMKNGMPAETLQKMRSAIRTKSRSIKGTDLDSQGMREMLQDAEDGVTEIFESQLPADAVQAVRNTDAKYRNLVQLADATRDTTEGMAQFTPHSLNASSRPTSRFERATGGGGEMRELSADGLQTISATVPKTGVMDVYGYPGVKHVTPLFSYLANTAPGKRFMLGQAGTQQALQRVGDAIGGNSIVKGVLGAGRGLGRFPVGSSGGAGRIASDFPGGAAPMMSQAAESPEMKRQRLIAQYLAGGATLGALNEGLDQ